MSPPKKKTPATKPKRDNAAELAAYEAMRPCPMPDGSPPPEKAARAEITQKCCPQCGYVWRSVSK